MPVYVRRVGEDGEEQRYCLRRADHHCHCRCMEHRRGRSVAISSAQQGHFSSAAAIRAPAVPSRDLQSPTAQAGAVAASCESGSEASATAAGAAALSAATTTRLHPLCVTRPPRAWNVAARSCGVDYQPPLTHRAAKQMCRHAAQRGMCASCERDFGECRVLSFEGQ